MPPRSEAPDFQLIHERVDQENESLKRAVSLISRDHIWQFARMMFAELHHAGPRNAKWQVAAIHEQEET